MNDESEVDDGRFFQVVTESASLTSRRCCHAGCRAAGRTGTRVPCLAGVTRFPRGAALHVRFAHLMERRRNGLQMRFSVVSVFAGTPRDATAALAQMGINNAAD